MNKWIVKATGDMTLSILNENGLQILKVDMLRQNTMKAGLNGDLLAKTLNDLSVIAGFSQQKYTITKFDLLYPEAGITSLPWCKKYDSAKRLLIVMNSERIIASRVFPKSFCYELIADINKLISDGLDKMKVTINS